MYPFKSTSLGYQHHRTAFKYTQKNAKYGVFICAPYRGQEQSVGTAHLNQTWRVEKGMGH